MRHKNILIVFFAIGVLVSCGTKATKIEKTATLDPEGLALLKTNCFSCHSPSASIENRLAPPMIAIKKHYITEGVSQKDFVAMASDFIKKPTVEKSKMPQAVKRFSIMPAMTFDEKQLKKMLEYIYDADIEAPSWFEEHFKGERAKYEQNVNDTTSYEAIGLKYAMAAKGVLGKNLMGAIAAKGTDEALAFCNTKAIFLTDSMAQSYNIALKRVSDKPRNAQNEANQNELAYIETAKMALTKGETIKPKVQELNGKMIAYYPIETNKMCLQCHGKPDVDIKTSTLEKIGSLYPKDKATGYGENQLRGIFVVEMSKK